MAGLQRSAISFRRQGSSGSVWDDKFLSELEFATQQELQQKQQQEQETHLKQQQQQQQQGSEEKIAGDRTTPTMGYRTVKVAEAEDPPSPKVAACGFCSVFGKSPAKKSAAKS